ncbi:glutamate synthase subunit beta [Brevibacterium sp. 50QC2O2]|uniref:glutamate synthase subunit beta n=1 Tax=Brevibacterium TaxID=1696 RepID=UPI00211BA421|nr:MULTISPECIES: glutamate synthase subunit beta [unclassified Brevibacterium]MCQ9366856.1 glutamate synthase subunit beta [Brevibacterium sp. 91QC2O2]MCQ9384006.1 glutamate synthase subunit beta [Brevibacterium sp. 68QC2CO]MCQ9389140.1 glutamate synthase subunit beta [Brevibacterium sp. 50QC2O2]
MADPRGFLKVRNRELPSKRPVALRLLDFKEIPTDLGDSAFVGQAGRCMDCGIPFCHQGCPLGNLIPEWNDAMYRDELPRALKLLHATNNFPEFTGRACPAPCEDSCVLGINQPPVTIKNIEVTIIDRGFAAGLVRPETPERISGKTVAVVGSGPAGLACAQQLTRAGHTVVVYEADDRIGGLLRYGIPDFKLEKPTIDRRIEQMRAEGTRFRTGVRIGTDMSWSDLRERFDAVCVCTGATVPRDLPVPGRDLAGVEYAMDYLVPVNRAQHGDEVDIIDAKGKNVIVIGGGDTGSDCLGTALRQQAKSVTTLAIGAQPPVERPAEQPWPTTPRVFEISSSHEEGGTREFLASTVRFLGDDAGHVRAVEVAETQFVDGRRVPTPGTEREIPADLVLISMGFTGPQLPAAETGIRSQGSTLARDAAWQNPAEGVFVAGDAGRGQSLIVWAIAEGRAAAAAIDQHLTGSTLLPAPVTPDQQALRA